LGAFGEKLRKQREQQGISLDAISDTTKISTRMLRALEEEHFDQLPGGVFNKGFVRAYARQVGLNDEEAVADYLAALRQHELEARSLSSDFRGLPSDDLRGDDLDDNGNDARNNRSQPLPVGDRRKQSRRSADRHTADRHNEDRHTANRQKEDRHKEDHKEDRHKTVRHRKEDHRPKDIPPFPDSPTPGLAAQVPWGKLAIVLLLVTFALALWNSRRHREPVAAAQPAPSSPQSLAPPQSAPPPTLAPAKASPGKTSSSGKLSSGTISTASAPSPSTKAVITLPAPSLSPPAVRAAPTAPTQSDSNAGLAPAPSVNAPRANPAVAEGTASAAAAKPPSPFSLLIRAEENTWVSITADGKPIAQETLIAPAHTSVRATGEVIVKAGNAAGISFQLNGEEIPAQGNEGEVKTFVFDAAGFRVLPQAR
jgi:cytoskeletal protein RodZ